MTFKDLVNKAAKLLNTETPEQKRLKIESLAEVLNHYNQILDDMPWQEGNLPRRSDPIFDYRTALNDLHVSYLSTSAHVIIAGGGGGGSGGGGGIHMETPPHPGFSSHFGMVRELRKQFKQYSKEEFRELSKEPVVKNILTGTTKLTKEEVADRIKEHLDNIE